MERGRLGVCGDGTCVKGLSGGACSGGLFLATIAFGTLLGGLFRRVAFPALVLADVVHLAAVYAGTLDSLFSPASVDRGRFVFVIRRGGWGLGNWDWWGDLGGLTVAFCGGR